MIRANSDFKSKAKPKSRLGSSAVLGALRTYLSLREIPVSKHWRHVAICISDTKLIEEMGKSSDEDMKNVLDITYRVVRCGKRAVFTYQGIFLRHIKNLLKSGTKVKVDNVCLAEIMKILDALIQSVGSNIIVHMNDYVNPILFDTPNKNILVYANKCKVVRSLLVALSRDNVDDLSLIHI